MHGDARVAAPADSVSSFLRPTVIIDMAHGAAASPTDEVSASSFFVQLYILEHVCELNKVQIA